MKYFFSFALVAITLGVFAQDTTKNALNEKLLERKALRKTKAEQRIANTKKVPQIILGAYADTYYSYYLNGEANKQQVHNCIGAYNQTFGLNVAQVSAELEGVHFRGKVTLQFGDIPNIAWTGVSAAQEAYAGVKLGERTWFDIGYFKTHIGAESFLPKDNLMSQIALATFYGPFYQSGARLMHETKNGWNLQAHLISGYNRQIDNNKKPSIGLLVSKEFSEHVTVSYSNLFGEEEVSVNNADFLFYNNIYTNLTFGKWKAQISADVATQMGKFEFGRPSENNLLFASFATVKRSIKGPHSISLKGEWFYDPSSINSRNFTPEAQNISASNVPVYQSELVANFTEGLNIFGATIGYEYAKPAGFLRIESRFLNNQNAAFSSYPTNYDRETVDLDGVITNRLGAMVTLGIYFDKKLNFNK